ncbi:MAG: LTA synthase family protein [Calditrichia bacterium]
MSHPPVVFFFWVVGIFMTFFFLARLALLIANWKQFAGIPLMVLLKSFLVGARFDLVVSLYVLGPLFVINYLFYLFGWLGFLEAFNRPYIGFFFLLYAFLSIAEIEYFKYFHVRLNAFFVDWEENPAFVLKMVWESYPVLGYLLLLILLAALVLYGVLKIEKKVFQKPHAQGTLSKLLVFLLLLPFIFVGARGTISYKTPLRWGHAYFSTYNGANQLALNGIFNLISDYFYQRKSQVNLEVFYGISDTQRAYREVQHMVADSSGEFISFPLRKYEFEEPPEKYNVIFILLESFSQYGLEKLETEGIPLYFNQIKKEGIYFPNFYSEGFHTYMGIFSSLFGMPNIYGKSVLKSNIGQQEFSGILNILTKAGYRSFFGVPHDPNFDNMTGFLRGNGLETVVSQFDFPRKEVLSALGVADHKLFEKMNERFRSAQEPFIGIILSSNNHGPWIIPEVPGQKFVSTLHYTDWALHHFLELAKRESYFQNTLFVITGDHGKAVTPGHDLNLQNTHIPCLIYNPEIVSPRAVQNICGQIDLPQTVLGLLKMDYKTTSLGRDILSLPNEFSGHVCMQEGKLLCLIWNEWYLIDRIGGSPSLYKYRSPDPFRDYAADEPEICRSLQQKVRSFFYVGNGMIFNRKCRTSAWE